MCVKVIDIVSLILIFDFGIISTVWYFFFHFYFSDDYFNLTMVLLPQAYVTGVGCPVETPLIFLLPNTFKLFGFCGYRMHVTPLAFQSLGFLGTGCMLLHRLSNPWVFWVPDEGYSIDFPIFGFSEYRMKVTPLAFQSSGFSGHRM